MGKEFEGWEDSEMLGLLPVQVCPGINNELTRRGQSTSFRAINLLKNTRRLPF